jgi:hypothetical protein
LIGIVSEVFGYDSKIISVDAIERRFAEWRLDFALSDWDYALKQQLDYKGTLRYSATLYNEQQANSALRNIVVMLKASQGKVNAVGLVPDVGAGVIGGWAGDRLLVWTAQRLVASDITPGLAREIQVDLANGATRLATVVRNDESRGTALLSVETTEDDIISLHLRQGPAPAGSKYVFPYPLESALPSRARREPLFMPHLRHRVLCGRSCV